MTGWGGKIVGDTKDGKGKKRKFNSGDEISEFSSVHSEEEEEENEEEPKLDDIKIGSSNESE